MQGNLITFSNFLIGPRLFDIPVYQRNYAWGERNLEDLWEDLYYLDNSKQHYYGTVLLKYSGQTQDLVQTFSRFEVIDGQQRLTTALILMREIISQMKSVHDKRFSEAASQLEEAYLKQGVHYKLNPLGEDRDFYHQFIVDNLNNPQPVTRSQHRLRKAKEFFRARLRSEKDRMSADQFPAFLVQLKQKIDDLQLIRYDVDSDADAIRIFETVNDRGRPLSNLEKTKSFLMHTSYLGMQDEAKMAGRLKELNDYFSRMYGHFDDVSATRHMDRMRLTSDDVQRYHYINFVSTNYSEIQSPLDNLKRRIRNLLREAPEECVRYVLQYTKDLEKAFFAVKDIVDAVQQRQGELGVRIGKIFIIERLARIFQIVLASWLRFRCDPDRMARILELIEAFVIRVYIVSRYADGTGEGRLNQLAHRVHREGLAYDDLINELKATIGYYSDDQRFESALRSEGFYNLLSSRNIKYLLTEYEIHLRKRAGEDLSLNQEEILAQSRTNRWQVEHIWPQHPSVELSEDMQLIHQLHVHRLGNLTVTAWNASLGAKPFDKKRDGDPSSDPKIPAYVESDLRIQRDLKDYSEWTPETIREREDTLVAFAMERWSI